MITLALDTATPCPGIALARDGVAVAERLVAPQPGAGRRVAEELHGVLEASGIELADVGRIVVGVGPGGFTGLRIGIATAMGLGQALGIPVEGVSSLETLALGIGRFARPDERVAPVIDAKRGEVFAAVYAVGDGAGLEEILAPRAVRAEAYGEWVAQVGPLAVAGDGLDRVAPVLGAGARPLDQSEAAAIHPSLAIARADSGGARPVVPIYLRLPDAEVNRRRRESAAT